MKKIKKIYEKKKSGTYSIGDMTVPESSPELMNKFSTRNKFSQFNINISEKEE